MHIQNLPGWMPIWYGDKLSDYLQGEVGILTNVSKTRSNALSLTMKYRGKEYNGWLTADFSAIEEIFLSMKHLLGHPITEVANTELRGRSFPSRPHQL